MILKNNKSLFLFACIFIGSLGFSQNSKADIELGTPYRVVDAPYKEFFKVNDNTMVSVKKDSKRWYTQVHDTKSLKQKNFFEAKISDKKLVLEQTLVIQNKVNIFYSLWDRREELEQLFVMEVDNNTASLSAPKKVVDIKGKLTGTFVTGKGGLPRVADKFKFYLSSDESKTVIQYRKKPEERRDQFNKDIIGFVVMDDSKSVIWDAEVEMPYTEALMDNLDYAVSSEGNVYILTKVYKTDRDRKEDNFHVEIFELKKGGKKFEKFKVSFDGIYIRSLKIQENKQGEIVCAGYYNKEKQYGQVDGVMTFKIDKANQITNLDKYEIPKDIINEYQTRLERKKNDKKEEKDEEVGFKELKMDKVLFNEDGSIILIGEQRYYTVRVYYTSSGMKTSYTHYFRTVLVTKIDVKGELAWMKSVPKYQLRRSSSYVTPMNKDLSYSVVEAKDDGVNIVYFDNVKNLNIGKDEIPERHVSGRGGYLTSMRIDKDGNTKKISLFDVGDVNGMKVYQYEIRRILEFGKDHFIMEVYKKKKEDILIDVKL